MTTPHDDSVAVRDRYVGNTVRDTGDTTASHTSRQSNADASDNAPTVAKMAKDDNCVVVHASYANAALKFMHIHANHVRAFTFAVVLAYTVLFVACAQSQAHKFWTRDGVIAPGTFDDQREMLMGLMAYAIVVWSLCCFEMYYVLSIDLVPSKTS